MRCKKLRKIYPKYTDGELSEQERQSVEEHIRDCPDCAAAVNSLGRMRSLLQTAAEVEVSDEYWDTYWDRLEKKLPDEPARVTLASRMSGVFVEMFRRPMALGRVAVSIIFLAFLIYAASDYLSKTPPVPPRAFTPAKSLEEAETETFADVLEEGYRKSEEISIMDDEARQPSLRAHAGDTINGSAGKTVEALAERAAGETDLGLEYKPSEIKESAAGAVPRYSYAAPAKPGTAPAPSSEAAKVRGDFTEGAGYDIADFQDEYMIAENHFQNREYLQAIPAYQNFIDANTIAKIQDDRTLKAVYQIGEAHYQMGNYSDALSNFVAVADADKAEWADADGAQSPDLSGWEAGLKKDEKAKGVVGVVARSEPQAEIETRTRARREIKTRGAVVPEDAAATLDQARDLSKDLNETLKKLTPIETRERLISRAIFRQAQSYENLKQHEQALDVYNKYVERYPGGEYVTQAREKVTRKAAEAQKEAQKQEKAGKAESGEKDK